jgi:hypothetical protein
MPRPRLQFSIGFLFRATLYVAIVAAALANAPWHGGTVSIQESLILVLAGWAIAFIALFPSGSATR